MGEDPTKTNRVNTKPICTSIIKDWLAVFGGCANATVVMRTLVEFNTASIEDDKVPFLHYAARKIALFISSPQYLKHLQQCDCKAKFNYFMFSILDRTLTTFSQVLKHEDSITAAAASSGNSKASEVNTAWFKSASLALENGLLMASQVTIGAHTLDAVAVYTNSVFGETKAKVPAAAAAVHVPSGPAKRTTAAATGDNAAKKQKKELRGNNGKNVGAFICKACDLMPLPSPGDYPQGETALCAGKLRNESHGCRNPATCKLNHGLPHTWSKALLGFMKTHVANTACLEWNYAVASPELLGMVHSTNAVVPVQV